jgi:hypothetical protein
VVEDTVEVVGVAQEEAVEVLLVEVVHMEPLQVKKKRFDLINFLLILTLSY